VESEPSSISVVRFQEDNKFYRAEIIGVKGQFAQVLFVDKVYVGVQDVPLADLKRIIPRFLEIPQMASLLVHLIYTYYLPRT